jgi:two-component system, sensor histidine kinase and response regulator
VAKSILIVDDNPENQRILIRLLTSQGYQLRTAKSGVEALAIIEQDLPDLILLDIMMPGMDGYEVCRRLKAEKRTCDIPVLFVSALDQVFDKVSAFQAGGVDYIAKPFELEEVLARVETHLTLRSLQLNLERQIAELDSFAHTVAHDLKNPLHIILGYSDVLATQLADTQNELLQECVAAIVDTSAKMATVIDELLLLASVRAVGDVKLEQVDMAPLVAMAMARLAPMITELHAEIIVPETWPVAMGHGPWIEEVWMNYISNALKYGGRPPRIDLGSMVLDSRLPFHHDASAGTGNQPSRIKFWVRDNGQGLSQEEQAKLFVPFMRLHQSRVEGHGLGLSIVRRILDRLGGQAGVESALGQGSTFFFTLPGVEKGA